MYVRIQKHNNVHTPADFALGISNKMHITGETDKKHAQYLSVMSSGLHLVVINARIECRKIEGKCKSIDGRHTHTHKNTLTYIHDTARTLRLYREELALPYVFWRQVIEHRRHETAMPKYYFVVGNRNKFLGGLCRKPSLLQPVTTWVCCVGGVNMLCGSESACLPTFICDSSKQCLFR